jgi:hypothetical protein
MSQLIELNVLEEDERLRQEWDSFATKQDRLEEILRRGGVESPAEDRLVVSGLELLAKQLSHNRVSRYLRERAHQAPDI